VVANHAWLASGAFCLALADGAYTIPERLGAFHFVALVSLLGLLGLRVGLRFQSPAITAAAQRTRSGRYEDLSLGLLLIVTLHVLFQMTGGLRSPLYPLTYLFVAFAAAFAEVWAGRLLLLVAVAAEGLAVVGAGFAPDALREAPAHAGFILIFGLAWTGFLRAQILFQRRQHKQVMADDLQRLEQEAREFRLIASPLSRDSRSRTREEEQLVQMREGVRSIQRTVCLLLETLADAYQLTTCALYWVDEDGRLRVREATSQSDRFTDRPLGAGEGLPGAVVSTRKAVRMHGLKSNHKGLPYYLAGEQVFAFLGTPLFQGRHVRGVLVADRRHALPFSPDNEHVFALAAQQIAQAIDNERVFLETEQEKDAQEHFHRAVKSLNTAQEPDAAADAILHAVNEIATYGFAALVTFDHEARTHTVVRVDGAGKEELEGLTFAENQGLASQVVRTAHALPVRAQNKEKEPFVFTREAGPSGVRSLLVLPLTFSDEVVATLTLASAEPEAYPAEVRARLEVVASAAAVSLVNSINFGKVRDLATTDGLTGLFNRRVFMDRFDDMLARAKRSGRPLSLILADIDHFKRVNDTGGHPAGDEMLRAVSAALNECVRETDVVARYGGEEFAILLEEADPDGGLQMAERIRCAVEELPVEIGAETIRATLSAGCTTWTGNGYDRDALVEQADQALYRGKELGRNRVLHFLELEERRPAAAEAR